MNNSDANIGQLIIPSTTSTSSAKDMTPVSGSALHHALVIVDTSGVCTLLDTWALADGVASEAPSITQRQLLAAWLILALEGRTPTITGAAQVLGERLPRRQRAILGIPASLAPLNNDQIAGHVRRATTRLLGLMDAYPLPTRGRRLSKQEWDAVTAERVERATQMEAKRRRFVTFANRLLGAQFDRLPQETRATASAVVLASRFRPVHAKGIGARRMATLSATSAVSSEPDAGFYVRPAPDGATLNSQYGWEDELVILSPTDTADAPRIVIGFNPHRPGAHPARHASEALQHLARRGTTLNHVLAGRAYMSARPDYLRAALRDLGAKVIGEYPRTALGVQDTTENAILAEGTWYDASMPSHLQNAIRDAHRLAPADGANSEGADADIDALVAQRAAYALRPAAGSLPRTERLEQALPYRSVEWMRARASGRNTVKAYLATLRRNAAHTPGVRLRGATGHAFLSLLNIMGTNARIITNFAAATRSDPTGRCLPRPSRTMTCPAPASAPSQLTCNP